MTKSDILNQLSCSLRSHTVHPTCTSYYGYKSAIKNLQSTTTCENFEQGRMQKLGEVCHNTELFAMIPIRLGNLMGGKMIIDG